MGRFYLNEIFYKKSLLFCKLADLSITIPQRRRILNYVITLCGGSFKIENSIYLYTFKSIQIHVSILYLAPIWHFNTLEHQYPNISIHLLLLYYLEFRLYYRISIVCNCLNLSQLGILRFEWYITCKNMAHVPVIEHTSLSSIQLLNNILH